MSETVSLILENADYFILLLFRVAGLVVTSPIFGRVNIPNSVKVGLSVLLTFFFFGLVPVPEPIAYDTLIGFALICASEVLVGVILSFVTNLFFALTFIGGQLIDMQIGFGIVNVYDQQNNTQVPMVGNILNLALLLIFFSVNGHHRLIQILYVTLEKLPVGNLSISLQIGMVALELFAKSFTLGIMVALPVVASGLVLELCFGVLVRTVPQLNMFVVGIPLKLLVGLLILSATLPVFASFSETIFTELFIGVEKMLETLTAVS